MAAQNREIVIACVGDTSDCAIAEPGVPVAIREILDKADLLIWNCESPIHTPGEKIPFYLRKWAIDSFASIFGSKQPRVVSTPRIAKIMQMAETNVATLAANHILDAGAGNIPRTRQYLEEAGQLSIGAGRNRKEALDPLSMEIKGNRIGIVNYNRVGWNGPVVGYMDVYGAGRCRAGAAPYSREEAREKMQRLRKENDLVIACLHVGRCGEEPLKQRYHAMVDRFFEWGANLVIVHHSHTMGGVKALADGRLAILGMGDFMFNCSPYPDYTTFYFVTIHWRENRGFSVQGYPIMREKGIPRMANPSEAREVSTHVKDLSRLEDGWRFEIDPQGRWSLFRKKHQMGQSDG